MPPKGSETRTSGRYPVPDDVRVRLPKKHQPPAATTSWWLVPPELFSAACAKAQARMSPAFSGHVPTNYSKPTGKE